MSTRVSAWLAVGVGVGVGVRVVVDERACLEATRQPREVARLGASELVDALVVVADHGDLNVKVVS